ncbi:MAG TPA: bifunctional 5,10-methylenetetrahydrofolate dehydrogenase/5,10-methenyltetrahydrofolate cyclohydrolase [Candidatus Saccharimonadales bacterium]|nr:bifunctional 5,10-methylenetetrahydrofolate dehydrogenase/5,10-methenyltetrahydrofolate cyclohydrolase [Candidatus Saccharimonadales bacterium]
MRFLNGADLAGYMKERQARQVRGLRQAAHVFPRLAIILTDEHPASLKYIQLKQKYGEDILVDVVVEQVSVDQAITTIERHNQDPLTHGTIVQLPIADPSQTDAVLRAIAPEKDVDGLGSNQFFDPATPTAILWLMAGYNIEPRAKKVVVIGQGRLVGTPLVRMLQDSGVEPIIANRHSDLVKVCEDADIIITATGHPGLLTSDIIPQKAVVIDAGVAGEGGVLKGDVADDVYTTRDDLTITPQKGGVGPLTVIALFDAVIRAARRVAENR